MIACLYDLHGRKMDDLDVLKLRLAARRITEGGYSVVSEDGVPICGFVPNDQKTPVQRLVAWRWKKDSAVRGIGGEK